VIDVTKMRVLVELGLAFLWATLLTMTLTWPDWIEQAFGFDPDAHSGAFEWAIVVASTVLLVSCVGLARRDFRRLRVTTT